MDSNRKANQTNMHAFLETILCRLCNRNFTPKRKNQVFCSPSCRLRYFDVARRIGVIVIENIKKDRAILELLIRGKKANEGISHHR